MKGNFRWPCALTIAGSDSGGGAGIQADLKTFAALRVHGTSAITCVTAQNPDEVRSIQAVKPRIVIQQIEAVLDAFPVQAVKLGMLYSTPTIEAIGRVLHDLAGKVVIIADPVMISTSGKQLLQPSAQKAYIRAIIPQCDLLTPNLPEAEVLGGIKITNPEELRASAELLHKRFGCAVLAKGGHLKNCRTAIDIYYNGATELLLEAPFIKGAKTHGTGCTYSAAICAYSARKMSLQRAVTNAKNYISASIANSLRVGRQEVLNPAIFES
jgi:hydroxymethylpyrimidine/phosphomethylpyrimidine kinase